ncbi:hypothetical protein [Bythopirellula polymerisocia]|uniref:Uncharacterized protein n=1 Tax=Bythopirellula polymerisocia TaxID=2528003 RepID=A0A5C6CPU4_9BACT|nr:hypothetical protein [Bythopirellula polymerisocia]TWU26065.1 hypothetical protein Pla144_32820 [Bythopirellula polymerisocia]
MVSVCTNSLKPQSPTDSILLNMLQERSCLSDESKKVARSALDVYRDGEDNIINVKIGRWRVLSSNVHRRIVEVRELACERVAVRIELDDHNRLASHCTIWELYDHQGHLLSMLQDLGDREIWLTTGFRRKE